MYDAGHYDVAVIGAGHAGIEAALSAARLGCRTVMFTINMDAVGNCRVTPVLAEQPKDTWCGKLMHWGRSGKTTDACFFRAGCSIWEKDRRFTPCGPRLIGGL